MALAVALPAVALPAVALAAAMGPTVPAGAAEPLRVVHTMTRGTTAELTVAVPGPLTGRALADSAFTVESDAGPVTVTTRRLDPATVDVAVVMTAPRTAPDAPSSTTAADVQRAALVEMLDAFDDGARVAVIADDPPRVVAGLDGATDAAVRALATRPASPLRQDDALRLASEAVRTSAPSSVDGSRRLVVLAIGGGLPRSEETPSWWPSGTSLFTVRVEDGEAPAAATTNPTGGTTATADPRGAVGALDAVAADLRGQYRIAVSAIPVDATRLTVQVTSGEVAATAAYVLDRGESATVPTALPETPTAAPVGIAADGSGGDRNLVLVLLVVTLLVAGVGLLVWRSRWTTEARPPAAAGAGPADREPASPASSPTSSIPAPTRAPEPTIIVLAGTSASRHRASLRDATCTIVHSPIDALHAAVRHGAATIVVEPGAGDAGALVDAVTRHDLASDRTTRVVQIADDGRVIDLRAPVGERTDEPVTG